MKRFLTFGLLALSMIVGGMQLAGQPIVNIGKHHGELRAAQQAIVDAYDRISDAQANNHDQLGGHAARAKEFLTKADEELRRAADFANDSR